MKRILVVLLVLLVLTVSSASANDQQFITAKSQGDCKGPDSEWHWVINQLIPAQAPAKIVVHWSDGDENVPLDKVTPGGVAHYSTVSHGSEGIYQGAETWIYVQWDGQFNLSHRPCDDGPTETPTPTYPPPNPTPTPTEPTPTPTPGDEPTPSPEPTPEDTPTPGKTPKPKKPKELPQTGFGDKAIDYVIVGGILTFVVAFIRGLRKRVR